MGRIVTSVDELLSLPVITSLADRPADVVAAAVFDADHCLWAGDIGDTAFAGAGAAGLVAEATWRGPVQTWARAWDLTLADEPIAGIRQVMEASSSGTLSATAAARGLPPTAWKGDLYAMQAWIYAGQTPAAIEAWGERLFGEGFSDLIYGGMRDVIAGLLARGIAVWIASASHRDLVVPGARRLGIPAERVLGMQPVVDDGVTTTRLQHSTYGPGKAAVAVSALGGRPLLAFGDSVLSTDKELLAAAHLGIGVATSGDARAAALADDHILLFDPAR